MLSSAIPTRFKLPFANAAAGPQITYPIPDTTVTPGRAALDTGFPPLNFLARGAGGIPPFGQDFNGILKQITLWAQWLAAGGPVFYDAAFSTTVGGYPKGAILASTTLGVQWISTVDNNTTDPDGGSPANWNRVTPGAMEYISDTGVANAYVITPVPAISAYIGGQRFLVKPLNTNTGASTIAVNGLAAKAIVHADGNAVLPGDMPINGLVELIYQSTLGKFILNTPVLASFTNTPSAGYFRIPNTPFILQWIKITSPAGAGSGVSMPTGMNWYNYGSPAWPLTFPNACLWWYGSPTTTNDTYFWLFQGDKAAGALNNLFITRNTNAIAMLATDLYLFAIGW